MYKGCSIENEYGFLGFDKTGRQIYIQSLNQYFQGNIIVESEFYDENIFLRFLNEPTRTTLRYKYNFSQYPNLNIFGEPVNDTLIEDESRKLEYRQYIFNETEKTLGEPVENILLFLSRTEEFYISERATITFDDLKNRVQESECKTVEDFYKGLGFKVYEVFIDEEFYYSKELKHWSKKNKL